MPFLFLELYVAGRLHDHARDSVLIAQLKGPELIFGLELYDGFKAALRQRAGEVEGYVELFFLQPHLLEKGVGKAPVAPADRSDEFAGDVALGLVVPQSH